MATHFSNTALQILPVNFVKSVITVVPKGDLDGELSTADVLLMLNCIFLTDPFSRAASPCDVNCDRRRSPADAILFMKVVFAGAAFPC